MIQAQAPLASLVKASLAWAFSFQFLTQPGIFDALLELNLENPYPFSIQGYKNQYQALIHFDSQHWAKKISVPSLVLAGDQDVIFIEPSVRQLATEIPNARYVCFTDCGHLPQIEYPQRFVESVGTFHHDCS